MEGGELFNTEILGQGFTWWVGQVVDDSAWRDNIIPGKFDDPESSKGWGYRYKVRIIGLHDRDEESISSDQLPWANIIYPVTAGGGGAAAYQTPAIRQGNFVFGFFQDGMEQQVPTILGIIGNNGQIPTNGEFVDGGNTFSCADSFSGNQKVEKERTELPDIPKYSLNSNPNKKESTLDEKQKDHQESVKQSNEIGFNNTPRGRAAEKIFQNSFKKSQEKLRKVISESPLSSPLGGKTTFQSVITNCVNAGEIAKDFLYQQNTALLQTHNVSDSATKSMQIAIDRFAFECDKVKSSITTGGYPDMVSLRSNRVNLKAKMENLADECSGYMSIMTDQMMQYTNKITNSSLIETMTEMPPSMRFMMADMKEITGIETLKTYKNIGKNIPSQLTSVLGKSFDIDDILGKAVDSVLNPPTNINFPFPLPRGSTTSNFQNLASSVVDRVTQVRNRRDQARRVASIPATDGAQTPSTGDIPYSAPVESIPPLQEPPTYEEFEEILLSNSEDGVIELSTDLLPKATTPEVPICYAEDVIADVINANKEVIEEANKAIISNMNSFIDDMKSIMGEDETVVEDTVDDNSVLSITDEEVLDQTRGGSLYVTANNLSTGIYGSIKAGVTTSNGSGCIVDVVVSTGGLAGYGDASAEHFTWISQGTGYTNQNAVNCNGGSGTGMKVNYIATAGQITSLYVHTTGTGYKVEDELTIQAGNFDAKFTLNVVEGKINDGGITVVNAGSNYQDGDVLFVIGGNNDATFTVTATRKKAEPSTSGGGGGKSALDGISGLLGKLGGIEGNLAAALDFKNMKLNVFPFELPTIPSPNEYFNFGAGGLGLPQVKLPSKPSLANAVNTLKNKVPIADAQKFLTPFPQQPSQKFLPNGTAEIVENLKDNSQELIGSLKNIAQNSQINRNG